MSSESHPGMSRLGCLSRRSFLQNSGGAAAGLAVMVVPPAALALASPAVAKDVALGEVVHPEGDVSSEPVMAYVHDAAKGEVTVLWGTTQKTYRDPALAKRLLDAARAQTV
jgi:hypothetical protein